LPIKVLLINFPRGEIYRVPSNVEITDHSSTKIAWRPTLHDYHAIILDAEEILDEKWRPKGLTIEEFARWIKALKDQIHEQIQTGGLTFCFSGAVRKTRAGVIEFCDNYFWSSVDLGVVSRSGDTFYPKSEELKYFTPLLKGL